MNRLVALALSLVGTWLICTSLGWKAAMGIYFISASLRWDIWSSNERR